MKQVNNILNNPSNFFKIILISLMFVGCGPIKSVRVPGLLIPNNTIIEGIAITVESTKAGITDPFTITAFVNVPTVAVTFDPADDTTALQTIAVKNAIAASLSDDTVLKNMKVVLANNVTYTVLNASSATVKVMFRAADGYEFKETMTTQTVKITLSGTFSMFDRFIKTAADLKALEGKDITDNYMFKAADGSKIIDMTGVPFTGIKSFAGILDGNGHTINNLIIDNISSDAGLILEIPSDATTEIKNLTIDSGNITGSESVSAFVAKSEGVITLTGLTNKASVTGTHSFSLVGGIIGQANDIVTINNTENSGNISGTGDTGGIIGKNAGVGTINNVGNSGTITGTRDKGGIVGNTSKKVTLNNAYNHEDMKLIGKNDRFGESTTTSSYRLDSITEEPSGVSDLTIDEFKDQANFIGWDFTDIWKMGTAYPELR